MEKKKTVGYEAFEAWEVRMAHGKARGLIGKHGFTYEDLPDLEQELLLEIYLKRGTRDTWTHIEASQKTVLNRILDNRIRDIIDAIRTDKRRIQTLSKSLSQEIHASEDEGSLNYEDVLSEDRTPTRIGKKPFAEEEELRSVLSAKLANLSDSQKTICTLLMRGTSVSEAAESLGMKRTTLYRELERMRKLFYKEGLHEYL